MKKETPKTQSESLPQRSAESTQTKVDKTKGLDFAKLDLKVERVDERLSPSETNIFDK